MSTVVSCSWIARRCDPGHSVHASKMQQRQRNPTAEDIAWANAVAKEMSVEPDRAIVLRKCLEQHGPSSDCRLRAG